MFYYTHLDAPHEWRFEVDGKPEKVTTSGSFGANNGDVLCEAAVHGMGIVYLPAFIADRALHEGALVPILKEFTDRRPLEMYVLYPSRSFMPAALKLFLQAVAESCSMSGKGHSP